MVETKPQKEEEEEDGTTHRVSVVENGL
jgi:hypothetical protein